MGGTDLIADPTHAALQRAVVLHPGEETPRAVLADWWQEHGRDDVAAMWRGALPARRRTRKRVDRLTAGQTAVMGPWAAKWIAIGLSTEPADRPLFEAAVTQCYLAANLNPPRIVWCSNPLVAVAAGCLYSTWAQRGDAVHDAVGDAVGGAVRGAVRDAVRDAVRGAVGDAVGDAVRGAVDGAVGDAVRGAVRGAVGDAVGGAVGDAVRDLWHRYFGGQFWAGWYWWNASPASVTFFLDVLNLKLPDHIERAARAYAATAASACWWWPHRDVVFVSERPHTLQVRPDRGPLVLWDDWGVGTDPVAPVTEEVT